MNKKYPLWYRFLKNFMITLFFIGVVISLGIIIGCIVELGNQGHTVLAAISGIFFVCCVLGAVATVLES